MWVDPFGLLCEEGQATLKKMIQKARDAPGSKLKVSDNEIDKIIKRIADTNETIGQGTADERTRASVFIDGKRYGLETRGLKDGKLQLLEWSTSEEVKAEGTEVSIEELVESQLFGVPNTGASNLADETAGIRRLGANPAWRCCLSSKYRHMTSLKRLARRASQNPLS